MSLRDTLKEWTSTLLDFLTRYLMSGQNEQQTYLNTIKLLMCMYIYSNLDTVPP